MSPRREGGKNSDLSLAENGSMIGHHLLSVFRSQYCHLLVYEMVYSFVCSIHQCPSCCLDKVFIRPTSVGTKQQTSNEQLGMLQYILIFVLFLLLFLMIFLFFTYFLANQLLFYHFYYYYYYYYFIIILIYIFNVSPHLPIL